MRVIGVKILPTTKIPEDAANRMQDLTRGYQASIQLRVHRQFLDVTSETDLAQLANYPGEQLEIMADGSHDEQKLLSVVHDELIGYKACY